MIKTPRQATPAWAYVYEIVPPQSLSRLRTIEALLQEEHSTAVHEERIWASRLVTSGRTTRILVISDSVARDRSVNRQLVTELHRLAAECTISEPVALAN